LDELNRLPPIRSFDFGDLVLLEADEHRPARKDLTPWSGPWVVRERLSPARYLIADFNDQERTTNAHVDRLKLFELPADIDPEDQDTTLHNIAAKDLSEFVIDHIVVHRRVPPGTKLPSKFSSGLHRYQFLVRWRGFDESEDTWEFYEDLKKSEAITKYLDAHPELRKH